MAPLQDITNRLSLSVQRPAKQPLLRQSSLQDLFAKPATPRHEQDESALRASKRRRILTEPSVLASSSSPASDECHHAMQWESTQPTSPLAPQKHQHDSSDEEDDDATGWVEPVRQLHTRQSLRASTKLGPVALLGMCSTSSARSFPRALARHTHTTAHLLSLSSSANLDVYRLVGQDRSAAGLISSDFAPPMACQFSHGARRGGGKNVCAVVDETGIVTFLDADGTVDTDREQGRHAFSTHENAVFALQWSPDDSTMLTGSGDHTASLHDVKTGNCVGELVGHQGSVKTVDWHPHDHHLVATGSRDGTVRLWDVRAPAADGNGLLCVNLIRNAHCEPKKGMRDIMPAARRSVTSVTFIPNQDHLLASAGSADGMVRFWDVRRPHSNRINPDYFQVGADVAAPSLASLQASSLTSPLTMQRSHGISSLTVSPVNGRLYAISTASYAFSLDTCLLPLAGNLSKKDVHAGDLAMTDLQIFTSPSLGFGDFYRGLTVSTDGRYLAAGSTTGAHLWDTANVRSARDMSNDGGEQTNFEAVTLDAGAGEVTGLAWGRDETLLTIQEDRSLRIWRPRQCVEQNPEYARSSAGHTFFAAL
ncbi:uncharacterized protein L969DRAFT_19163 [Mixia osmundae IAM 14324]|uniref:Uncharacterized protein n=1 Tax=Mixia osmundae (strain CBS 9802 / IAM 14324 / JCM 22182 / KY 12970) TaxID=764103 RepID=G7E4N7_MIXOS|nr:uncharacterized protein L969DRAFT_19163 [Mixia osmundae IAM 14324]KEI37686.1 hypothetical protein L969DRAFT_19163 [Mixia osmundae IAM 14324]GAA97797.1 hypothetical protein E5Q_04476 [Mixia osmundae IAM 14324]